jgi:hydrogenase nickel incorporation protein HypA/HybF
MYSVMHELSLAMNLISIAEREVQKNGPGRVRKVRVMFGRLSGVDQDAFTFMFDLARKYTLLEAAEIDYEEVPGHAVCRSCKQEFETDNYLPACPYCGSLGVDITGGMDFRIISITVEESNTD